MNTRTRGRPTTAPWAPTPKATPGPHVLPTVLLGALTVTSLAWLTFLNRIVAVWGAAAGEATGGVAQRILSAGPNPDARLFTGPRGGRISTAVLRDATHWDDVVTKLGYEHLRRHDLRHTGLTWFADAGVHVHVPSAGSPATVH